MQPPTSQSHCESLVFWIPTIKDIREEDTHRTVFVAKTDLDLFAFAGLSKQLDVTLVKLQAAEDSVQPGTPGRELNLETSIHYCSHGVTSSVWLGHQLTSDPLKEKRCILRSVTQPDDSVGATVVPPWSVRVDEVLVTLIVPEVSYVNIPTALWTGSTVENTGFEDRVQ